MVREQLLHEVKSHWRQLRGMTYDLLNVLKEQELTGKLPFAASQDVLYQFLCMLGTEESWLPVLTEGSMTDWACSLLTMPEGQTHSIVEIRQHLQAADQKLFATLEQLDLLQPLANGSTPLKNYMILVEHEAHHQGQLINFIYALDLPIPESWANKWALQRG